MTGCVAYLTTRGPHREHIVGPDVQVLVVLGVGGNNTAVSAMSTMQVPSFREIPDKLVLQKSFSD